MAGSCSASGSTDGLGSVARVDKPGSLVLDASVSPPQLFFGGFGAMLLLDHLPRRFALILSGGRRAVYAKDKTGEHPGFLAACAHVDPLFSTGRTAIRKCEFEEKAWVVPMLLGQPILTALMYWQISARV